jgi:hypothetical protein
MRRTRDEIDPGRLGFFLPAMIISVQFLEGGPDSARIAPDRARELLRSAFGRLPIDNILLGWNLPAPIVEACAAECSKQHADLYLWHPLLTGDGVFTPRPEWRTLGVSGNSISDSKARDEFTFVCPNRPAAREAVLRHLDDSLSAGFFQGVFLDRIRFPSPAENPSCSLACFCDDCARAAASAGVDLALLRRDLERRLKTPDGKRSAARFFLSAAEESPSSEDALNRWMDFRCRSVLAIVKEAAGIARTRGLKVGLDCFSPALAPMVGQNLEHLSACCDWIKGMTYIRAFGPASIPFEIQGLADWILSSDGEEESRTMSLLAEATGWNLPSARESIRRNGLPSTILTGEITRGRNACACPFLAGIELVEIPGVAELDPQRVRADLEALLAAQPDGMALSWDLRHIPPERLDLLNRLLSHPVDS